MAPVADGSSESESDDGLLDILPCLLLVRKRKWKKYSKRYWVHQTLQQRQRLGEFHRLVQELKLDSERFHTYFRMSCETFRALVDKVGPVLYRQTTNFRQPICPEQRLAITLRFLATGDAFTSIAFSYRVGTTTVANVVKETCKVLWDCLHEEVMPKPNRDHWLAIAQGFEDNWQFGRCIGAIDGKHIKIQAPPNSGSLYFNYKKYFSIILLALVDANYRFVFVDIGSYGSSSDGGVYAKSNLGKQLERDVLQIPAAIPLPGAPALGDMPYVLVGDEAFPLKHYLMRPYPGRNLPEDRKIFNYRLSRARRVSENAFGILTQRFRLYMRTLCLLPENAEKVVQATCVLHNYLRDAEGNYCEPESRKEVGVNKSVMTHVTQLAGNRPTGAAIQTRDKFKDFFNSAAGQVPWQTYCVRKGAPIQ